ncbi:MAG TPA: FAD-dependent oxidoreductase [Chloroflexia bacterium]|nr:FAD-dependent oxidoreductase [Chloroflexia bacterium]
MAHYKYLIIGGGMTAASAARGIREVDTEGSLGMISRDEEPPYNRPPLTKALWKGKPFDSIWRKLDKYNVQMHLGRTIEALYPADKRVVDDQGESHTYEKLLLATGATPRTLPFGGDEIIYYRNVDDYRRLRATTEQGEHFAVIGGGFIGSEIAAALAMNGKKVTMVLPGKGIGDRMYPPELMEFVNSYYREKGVDVLPGERAESLERDGDKLTLRTQSGREISVDGVVAGIGVEPNTSLAEAAGLSVDDGIVVDELLRTSEPDIYAAGDVASYWDPVLGQRRRVEHEENANKMGRHVGRVMAGQEEPWHYMPSFYSDLFDLSYEAVGDIGTRLETIENWKEPFRHGAVYYMQDGRVRGVAVWGAWGQMDAARKLIGEPGPFGPEDLKGRLPEANGH